jgi:hypothetical protein
MRNLIVFGVVGLALGLAVQNVPRVLGVGDSPAGALSDAGLASDERGRAVAVGSDESRLGGALTGEGAPAFDNAGLRSAAERLRSSALDAQRGAATAATTGVEEALGAESGTYTLASELTADRLQRLIAAGFSSDRADEILRKESQLRRTAVESEYAASGTIRGLNGSAPAAVSTRLRSELGDDEYARYLEALGEPTRIRVREVESDSVAANAGIQPGDEIISYAGKRVFNQRELNALMLQTPEGETVATTIMRDGQPLQLYVTGGALGIAQRAVR